MSDFRTLLGVKTDEVERPRPLAAGHYIGIIKNFELGQSAQKQTPYVRVLFTPQEETTDVASGANDGMDLPSKEVRRDFYLTPASLYRLSDFLDAVLGPVQGRSFDERLPDIRGAKVIFLVKATPSRNDPKEIYNEVDTVAAA